MYPLFESLEEQQQQTIKKHLEEVIEANRVINLTRIEDRQQAMLLHVEDSLTGLQELNASPEGRYGDLGSGAGFPGIPLAVASGRKTVLIDARKKKMDTVSQIIERIGLSDSVSVYAGRAELLARSEAESFNVLTARALSKIGVLLELASPLLAMGGTLICYKARVEEEELVDAERVAKMVGMSLRSDRSFGLGENSRRIIAYEKVARPKVKLPRMEGQAQKNPL